MSIHCACAPPTPPASQRKPAGVCPHCGARGRNVSLQTVKAMTTISLRCLQPQPYRFCVTQQCPIVYYSVDGSHAFTVEHVRERVYQKASDQPDVLICYCFQYRLQDIQHATAVERAAIIADIKAGIAADQCACDVRNPQGACCLGNISRIANHQ